MGDRPGSKKNPPSNRGQSSRPPRGSRGRPGRAGLLFGPRRAASSADLADVTYTAPPPPPPPQSASPALAPPPAPEDPSPSPTPSDPTDSDPGWTRMPIEEYSGPDPGGMGEGDDAPTPDNGNDDAMPNDDDADMLVQQPTAAVNEPQEPENELSATEPAAGPMAIDPALLGLDTQLPSSATGMARAVGTIDSTPAAATRENSTIGGAAAAEEVYIKTEPSAASAASLASQPGPVSAAGETTSIVADVKAENATSSQPTATAPEPSMAASAALTAASPTVVPAPTSAVAAILAPVQPPAPQPTAEDPCSVSERAYRSAMDEAFTTGHPHRETFEDIRQTLAPGATIRYEGIIAVIIDRQGNEHRVRVDEIDRIQAQGLGIAPSQFEQIRARALWMGALGGRGMLEGGDDGQDGRAGEEDSQGDIELPDRVEGDGGA